VEVTSVEDSDLMILSAREWGGFAWNNLELVSGRMPRDATEEAVVLGQTAAEVLKKKVGDPIQIETKQLKVVGIVKGRRARRRWIGYSFAAALARNHRLSQPDQRHRCSSDAFGTTEQQVKELTRQIEQAGPGSSRCDRERTPQPQ
jgi:hypothetical protein